jgi:hypothetical protein
MQNLTSSQKFQSVVELQTIVNKKQLSELRPKFLKALEVDKDLVFHCYQSNYFSNITNRDFDGSQNDFEMAEIEALTESIYYAEELDEKETRYHECKNYRGCVLAFQ